MSVYSVCVQAQSSSTELVIYSPTVGQAVTIAWPLSNGRRILPKGIRNHNRRHGLVWGCFCNLLSENCLSCQIVHTDSGAVMAFCNTYPSTCGFQMNLSQIYHTAHMEASYAHIPTIRSGRVPSMGTFISAFILSAPINETAPYFAGYCGKHQLDHPRIEQLAGNTEAYSSRECRGTMFVAGSSAWGASRSTIDGLLALPAPDYAAARARRRERLDRESAHLATRVMQATYRATALEERSLQRLHTGGGISAFAMQGFIEKCSRCSLYFLSSALRPHIRCCGQNN